MLGDDVMDGTKRGIGAIGHAIKNTLKGALLFGAIAAAVGVGFGLVGAIAGASGVALSADALWTGLVHVASTAAPYAGWGALAGGVVTGAASLIPGKDEGGLGLNKLFRRKPRVVVEQAPTQPDIVYKTAPAQRQTVVQEVPAQQPDVVYVPAPAVAPRTVYSDAVYAGKSDPSSTVVHNTHNEVHEAPRTVISNQQPSMPADLKGDYSDRLPPERSDYTTAASNPYLREGPGTAAMKRGDARESIIAK